MNFDNTRIIKHGCEGHCPVLWWHYSKQNIPFLHTFERTYGKCLLMETNRTRLTYRLGKKNPENSRDLASTLAHLPVATVTHLITFTKTQIPIHDRTRRDVYFNEKNSMTTTTTSVIANDLILSPFLQKREEGLGRIPQRK